MRAYNEAYRSSGFLAFCIALNRASNRLSSVEVAVIFCRRLLMSNGLAKIMLIRPGNN